MDKSKTRLFSLLYFCHFIDTVVRTSVGGAGNAASEFRNLYTSVVGAVLPSINQIIDNVIETMLLNM